MYIDKSFHFDIPYEIMRALEEKGGRFFPWIYIHLHMEYHSYSKMPSIVQGRGTAEMRTSDYDCRVIGHISERRTRTTEDFILYACDVAASLPAVILSQDLRNSLFEEIEVEYKYIDPVCTNQKYTYSRFI